MPYHTPVFMKEVLDALDLRPGAIVIDGTVGDGGHAEAILGRLKGKCTFLGLDLDPTALETAGERLSQWGKAVTLRQGDFREIAAHAAAAHLDYPTAILLDIGIRSAEIEESGRGFSFRRDEPLIMRFDGRTDLTTAASIVNGSAPFELRRILRDYGEEPNAARIAEAIVTARRRTKIMTTGMLVAVIDQALPGAAKHGRIHFATRTFQALRIAANDELGALAEALPEAAQLLAPQGRLAVISFHSLEDRIVKNAFRRFATDRWGEVVTKKPIVPSHAETAANPRARSAKLRVFKKS